MTTPTDDLAQALRELAANWRRHADKMYFAAHANRVRECADELDATVAAHESRAQAAINFMLPDSIMRQFRRAIEEAKNRKGMRVGLPKVEIDAGNFEGLLKRYEAACAAQPASVADGWVVVPCVPTEAMLAAIQDGGGNAYALPDHIDAEGAYGAMLAAAPQPAKENDHD